MSELVFDVAFGPVRVLIRADGGMESVYRALRSWLAAGACVGNESPDLVVELTDSPTFHRDVTGDVISAGPGAFDGHQVLIRDGRAWEAAIDRFWRPGSPKALRYSTRNGPMLRTVGRLPSLLFRSLHVHRFSQAEVRASTLLYRHLVPAVQACLLERDATFVHASSLREVGGLGMLISGWGGAGKTSGSAALYLGRPQRWQFLSDDLTILTGDGRLHFSPLPLNIFPYSTAQFRPLHDRVVGPMGIWDRLQWSVRGRMMGKKGVARRISPVRPPSASSSCPVELVVHLQRSRGDRVAVEPRNPEEIARVCRNVLLYELGDALSMSAAANAICLGSAPPVAGIDRLVDGAERVLRKGFRDRRAVSVTVPESTTVEQLGEVLETVWVGGEHRPVYRGRAMGELS